MAIARSAAELVVSYKLFVAAQNSQKHVMGQITSIERSERRTVTDSFVIGNDPPDQPFELIPGVSTDRTLRLNNVSLYVKDFKKTIGRDDQAIVSSLADQNTPFDIHEVVTDPNTGKSKTRVYSGCFLSDVGATKDIARGDIRVIETATAVFKTVTETGYN